jgi:hypothetical protein
MDDYEVCSCYGNPETVFRSLFGNDFEIENRNLNAELAQAKKNLTGISLVAAMYALRPFEKVERGPVAEDDSAKRFALLELK